ncbi:MAG: hypothetical protein CML39_08335 [Rhodobacteraceae bacterium]|nr:MAG: hypothetical protein CML39_08335 [Paracoccaceae bacterium]|tara:strand:+ start:4876 stop:5265 length:390 start_codon:yes stop_codon:yes gene_type:complete
MNNPKVPVSWGELFDKITILQIKSEKLCSPPAIKNVNTELHMLSTIIDEKVPNLSEAKEFEKELKLINQQLWDIEDQIREKERKKIFDSEFIHCARMVYITNDKRSKIKRSINQVFGSDLMEEKSYSPY